MIKIRLAGGLGNQILQLIAGLTYSNIKNQQLVLNSESLKNYQVKRDFKLTFLGFKEHNNFNFIDTLIFKFRLTFILNIISKNFITDKNFLANNNRFLNYYLDGYFHDLSKSKIGIKILSEKLKKVKLKNNFPKIDFENDVAIHVRRGDYLTKENKKIYKFLNINYYKSSLKKIDYSKIYIFSTEKVDFILNKDQTEIINYELDDVEEFILMSKFKKIIISNSTFSFCSALLCNKKNKEIVAPSEYYLNDKKNKIWINNFKQFNFKINYEV
tara:strand:+ start:1639 stop:2451 length:813 start_codon:yes stop_codon:yes gene_type:complete